jgi:hypothetical protein
MKAATLPQDTLLELMAYADGELEGADRERIEKLVAESAEAKAFVQNLEVLAGHVRLVASAQAPGLGESRVKVDGIADAVLACIEREEGNAAPANVVALDDVRAVHAERRTPKAAAGRWRVAAGLAAATLALAASVFVVMRGEAPTAVRDPRPSTPPSQLLPSPLPQVDAVKEVLATVGVDVETVDAPQAVSVFYVPAMNASASANASSVVVWIEDEVKP